MDILRPTQSRPKENAVIPEKSRGSSSSLAEEYKEFFLATQPESDLAPSSEESEEWLTVGDESYEPEFIPPVFEYQPKKKKKRFSQEMPPVKPLLVWFGGVLMMMLFLTILLLWMARDDIEMAAERGFRSLESAKGALLEERYDDADQNFREAKNAFEEAYGAIPFWSHPLLSLTAYLPGLTEGASAQNVLIAGIHIAESGPSFVAIANNVGRTKEKLQAGQEFSLLHFFDETKPQLQKAREELGLAEKALQKVSADDVPAEKRASFMLAKEQLPVFLGMIDTFESHDRVVEELLGQNGPRKYLFLLENNHELRATGGFIGSYALLEMQDGKVKNFFVDGIFNPDGQLRENIVPPKPLQKVSAGWSLHDSNWFPDFPTSAEKAIFFYEKTGGPTVDGVVVVTPTLIQKLLQLTGPVTLPQYNLTVSDENFFPVIQEEVEVNYDKEKNQPKAVLADLAPLLFERMLHTRDEQVIVGALQAVIESLNEKDMLLYVRDDRVEDIIRQAGWSGEVSPSQRDYLQVVHSNINGFKTDGVIEDTIVHQAKIESDGTVIDTVRITRRHTGGDTPYEWWNRVNANYMRVYVPLGSELLSATGHTYEFPESPLDYDRLGFRRDETVKALEEKERIDEDSGTRIGEESGKTVFGNWVYVSPKEEVTVEYRYRLPFRVVPGSQSEGVSGYSLLIQKQPGTQSTKVTTEFVYPSAYQPIWQTGRNLVPYEHTLRGENPLLTDLFFGVAFDGV